MVTLQTFIMQPTSILIPKKKIINPEAFVFMTKLICKTCRRQIFAVRHCHCYSTIDCANYMMERFLRDTE